VARGDSRHGDFAPEASCDDAFVMEPI